MPSKLIGSYNRLVVKNSQYTKDPSVASDMAIAELKRTWSETDINGSPEIMQFAPDAVLPNKENFIQNDKKLSMKAVAERNRAARKAGDITFMDIEYPDAPEFSNNLEVIEKSSKATTKIKVNGEPSELIVGSDDRTAVSNNPSWPLFYKSDITGLQQPLLDIDGNQARWRPSDINAKEFKQGVQSAQIDRYNAKKKASGPSVTDSDSGYKGLAYGPSAAAPLKGGFDEDAFQAWYAKYANKLDLSPNPDDVEHYYDWRAAYKAGATPDKEGHWPSKYKREGHPRLILDGVNTKTGERVE